LSGKLLTKKQRILWHLRKILMLFKMRQMLREPLERSFSYRNLTVMRILLDFKM
jgi:hypothetical protein